MTLHFLQLPPHRSLIFPLLPTPLSTFYTSTPPSPPARPTATFWTPSHNSTLSPSTATINSPDLVYRNLTSFPPTTTIKSSEIITPISTSPPTAIFWTPPHNPTVPLPTLNINFPYFITHNSTLSPQTASINFLNPITPFHKPLQSHMPHTGIPPTPRVPHRHHQD